MMKLEDKFETEKAFEYLKTAVQKLIEAEEQTKGEGTRQRYWRLRAEFVEISQ